MNFDMAQQKTEELFTLRHDKKDTCIDMFLYFGLVCLCKGTRQIFQIASYLNSRTFKLSFHCRL